MRRQQDELTADPASPARAVRGHAAASGSVTLTATVRSPAAVVGLQRAVGNGATAEILSVGAGSRTAPAVVQREITLRGTKSAQYKNKVADAWALEKDEAEVVLKDLCAWCETTSQLDQIIELGSADWDRLRDGMTGKEANEHATVKDALKAVPAKLPTTGKTVDAHAAAKSKIQSKGHDLAAFTTPDLEAVATRAQEGDGWDKAIASVWEGISDRTATAKQAADRTAKYATAIAAGNLIFTAAQGLVHDVWNVACSVAMSGAAGPNTTVGGGPRAVADILTAVAAWRRQQRALGAPGGLVTNFHVPGGRTPIQDKSRREVNADPTRGRQADFISTWGGTDINVHVDAA